jgi:peroxiredoxin
VAISADSSEDSAEFVAEAGVTVPLLADPELKVIGAYGVAMDGSDIAVPASFVVRSDGVVAWSHVGETQTDRPSGAELLEMARSAFGR